MRWGAVRMPKIGLVSLPKARLSDGHATRPMRAHVDATQRGSHDHRGDQDPAPDMQDAGQASREKNDSEHAQPNKECAMATREAVAGEMRRGMGKAGGTWPGNDDVDASVDDDVQR